MKKSLLFVISVCSSLLLNACGGGGSKPPVATHLSVTASAAATAGTPFNVTVSALDASGALVAIYSGTVHFTSTDAQALLPKDLALTNGSAALSVTIKTSGTQTITATASGLTAGNSAPITVSPGAATQFSFTVPSSVPAGTSFSLTVNALDASNNLVTGYSGTVHFTSTDSQSVLPANSTLTNGSGSFPATLKTSGNQTITATDAATASITGTSSAIAVSAGAGIRLSVTACPSTINARTTFHFTVTALDAANNVAVGYSGTVHLSSTDSQAMLPANSTLTAGTASFAATLETVGNQTITATDTAKASITGSSSSINVTAAQVLAITSGAPPNGTVGVNYGPSKLAYERCSFNQMGNITCTPCTPGGCGAYPTCAPYHPSYPCIRRISVFAGFTLTATGGVSPYTWSASGLPPAVTVNSIGELIGTPTSPGTFTIIATVTDSGLPAANKSSSYTLTIAPPPVPIMNTTPAPPPGVENQAYSYSFTASGYPPLTWSESGALPNGLAFSNSTGVLSGTPSATGSFPITVTATDQFKQSSTAASFTIMVSLHGFQATGNLTTPRELHTATLLGSGKVLVAGGLFNGNQLITSELFDPAIGSFAATGNMQIARSAHSSTLLSGTGRVLVAGGQTDGAGTSTATAELYDPTAATFASTGSMQTARSGQTATVLNTGKVLIVGGKGSAGNPAALSSAELYDPATGIFSSTGSMATARTAHTATLLSSGKVLVIGGTDATSKNLDTAEIYDPGTAAFTAVAGMMTVTRTAHTATLFISGPDSGKVLVAGGLDDTGKARNTAELFDPVSASFTATTNMVSSHASHSATLLNDGTVLLAGGGDPTNNITAVAEIFNPVAASFASTGSLVTARKQHTATLLNNGKVLATGGADVNGNALARAELYQ